MSKLLRLVLGLSIIIALFAFAFFKLSKESLEPTKFPKNPSNLANFSDTPFIINPGDRVAQAVLNKFEKIEWDEVTTLNETERGTGGFGHSGI